jgi:cytochrome P450
MKFALTFQMVEFLNTMPLLAPLTRFLMRDAVAARNSQWAYTTEAVNKRLRDESQQGRADFIDSMTRENLMSYDEILANASMLVLAGSDTTASLLSGAMYWIMRTPRVMEKLVAEVTTAFERESDITALSVVAKLPYLNAVLEESLRRYPPVPSLLARVAVEDDTVISGVHVSKGVLVSVHQSSSYWTARNFARPHEFLPERWLPEAKEPGSEFYHDNRAVLQPFSTGPRNCVGRNLAYVEMRLVVSKLLWNFQFDLCPESSRWNDQRSFLLWAKPPLMCQVHERTRKSVA